MKRKLEIQLGDEVADRLTNFTGIACGKAIYITGCTQFLVKPRTCKDNTIPDSHWIDEPQLKITNPGAFFISEHRENQEKLAATGGPQRDAPPTR